MTMETWYSLREKTFAGSLDNFRSNFKCDELFESEKQKEVSFISSIGAGIHYDSETPLTVFRP